MSNIFVHKFRVLALQFRPIRVNGLGFKYTANIKAKVTNTRLETLLGDFAEAVESYPCPGECPPIQL